MLRRKRLLSIIALIFSATCASAQTTAPTTSPSLAQQQRWWELQRPPSGPQTVVRVHDPCAIYSITDKAYYLYCTGRGVRAFRSDDLYHWTALGGVFDQQPAWARKEIPEARGLWAPDISYFDGLYHLYYSVSTFGSRRSCIGLAVSKSLDPNSADYRWVDQGKVIETHNSDNYNAIDPNLVMDEHDQPYMVFGSCWDGIRIVRLDRATGKPPENEPPPRRLVHRPAGKLYEGPYVMRHGDWFYMFISYDACCRGSNSTYNLRIGRSKLVEGPYIDEDGVPMLEGGGTLILGGYGTVRGPGHCGALTDAAGRQWMVHHFYDATDFGISKLQVRRIAWTGEGWPLLGEPVDHPVTSATPVVPQKIDPIGKWKYSVNFESDRTIELRADGSVGGVDGMTWQGNSGGIVLSQGTARDGAIECAMDETGEWFVGRDRSGHVVRGTRAGASSS